MIFISYRKEDSGDLAWALADKLMESFGKDNVFLDRHQIEPGDHWREEIEAALSRATVLLAIIGPGWLMARDEFGQRRIDQKNDVLASELSMALERNIVTIPLYLHGLKPFPPQAFPDKLAGLARQQGIEFDIVRDLASLISKLENLSGLLRLDQPKKNYPGGSSSGVKTKTWWIPDSIGSLFKGREEELKNLRNKLVQSPSTPANHAVTRQVVFGLGGIGKTRLAIEYAWRYQDNYCGLMFIVGDTPAQLRRSISELSAPAVMNLDEWKYPEEEVRMAAVIRWLCDNPGWLLIIDNADDKESVEAVQNLLASLRGGHVIITSRNSQWSKSVARNGLDDLPLEASKDFLLDRTDDDRRKTPQDEAVALELAKELGCLALALEQAGAYIQNRDGGLTLADYLARWREGRRQVRSWCDESVMHYARSVAITWETTMRSLSPGAVTLFRILSWFAPDPIPRAIVSGNGVIEMIQETVEASGLRSGEIDPEEALSELIAYSMTKKVDEQGVACVGLHRVVLQIMRDLMPQEAKSCTIVAAARLLELFAPKESYRPEAWMDWRLLIAHAEAIWEVLKPLPQENWNIELMKMLALYYLGQDDLVRALPIQREVLRLALNRYAPDDPEIFLAKNDLALMAPWEEKEQLYREALEGRIRIHTLESTETAETQFNFGSFLVSKDLNEAEVLLKQALATHAKIDNPYHWRTLMAEMVLGRILIRQGHKETGEIILRSNLEKKRQHLGFDHPDTLESINWLVSLLWEKNEITEAESLQNELIEGNRKRYGPQHINTITALNNLAKIKVEQGDLMQASEIWRTTAPFWQTRLSELNKAEADYSARQDALKQFAVDLNNCALGLRQCGLLDSAEECLRRALAIDERERPEDDPKIPHRLMNLSTALIMQEKLGEASQCLNRAWLLLQDLQDVTNLRVLFLQYTISQMRSEPGQEYLGFIKALLTGDQLKAYSDIVAVWEIHYLLVYLHRKLTPEKSQFIEALAKALNFKDGVTALEEYQVWREQEPLTPVKKV